MRSSAKRSRAPAASDHPHRRRGRSRRCRSPFEETFGADIHEGYGLTEMSGLATTFATGHRRKPGSVGKPSTNTEIRISNPDEGRVGGGAVPRPVGHPRLLERPGRHGGRARPQGWLSTGDLGYLDEDGDVFLVDRKKEMIIRGGYNVYPREVEEVLYEHPAVLEAAVIGVPHRTLGEDVAAIVVPRHPCRTRSRRGEGVGEGARRGIQVSSLRRVGRRVTEDLDRQDPQARDRSRPDSRGATLGRRMTLSTLPMTCTHRAERLMSTADRGASGRCETMRG